MRAYYHASRHKQSDPASIKSQVIRLRVTEAEAEMFKSIAINAGCKSISEYIRSRCIGEDDEHDKHDSGVDSKSTSDKSAAVKTPKKRSKKKTAE